MPAAERRLRLRVRVRHSRPSRTRGRKAQLSKLASRCLAAASAAPSGTGCTGACPPDNTWQSTRAAARSTQSSRSIASAPTARSDRCSPSAARITRPPRLCELDVDSSSQYAIQIGGHNARIRNAAGVRGLRSFTLPAIQRRRSANASMLFAPYALPSGIRRRHARRDDEPGEPPTAAAWGRRHGTRCPATRRAR